MSVSVSSSIVRVCVGHQHGTQCILGANARDCKPAGFKIIQPLEIKYPQQFRVMHAILVKRIQDVSGVGDGFLSWCYLHNAASILHYRETHSLGYTKRGKFAVNNTT